MQEKQRLSLYLAHRTALVDFATPIVGCRASAEDVVQEAFLRFVPAAPERAGAEPIMQPVGYLYRIVRNLAVDWGRRLSAERRRGDGGAILEDVPAPTASPEQAVVDRDELRVVAAALAELPERTRRIFELHRLEGRTLQDIADTFGISLTLTHQLVRKAISHCASRLDDANS